MAMNVFVDMKLLVLVIFGLVSVSACLYICISNNRRLDEHDIERLVKNRNVPYVGKHYGNVTDNIYIERGFSRNVIVRVDKVGTQEIVLLNKPNEGISVCYRLCANGVYENSLMEGIESHGSYLIFRCKDILYLNFDTNEYCKFSRSTYADEE